MNIDCINIKNDDLLIFLILNYLCIIFHEIDAKYAFWHTFCGKIG